MLFKCDLAFQNIPLSKQPFKTQPRFENEDVPWNPQYNLPVTRTTNKHKALSLQEVELDGRFSILHIVLDTCTISCMHKFNMSFVFQIYILGLTSWIWTRPSIERLNFENPSKWNSYEGFNLEHSPKWTKTPVELKGKLDSHQLRYALNTNIDIWHFRIHSSNYF